MKPTAYIDGNRRWRPGAHGNGKVAAGEKTCGVPDNSHKVGFRQPPRDAALSSAVRIVEAGAATDNGDATPKEVRQCSRRRLTASGKRQPPKVESGGFYEALEQGPSFL